MQFFSRHGREKTIEGNVRVLRSVHDGGRAVPAFSEMQGARGGRAGREGAAGFPSDGPGLFPQGFLAAPGDEGHGEDGGPRPLPALCLAGVLRAHERVLRGRLGGQEGGDGLPGGRSFRKRSGVDAYLRLRKLLRDDGQGGGRAPGKRVQQEPGFPHGSQRDAGGVVRGMRGEGGDALHGMRDRA